MEYRSYERLCNVDFLRMVLVSAVAVHHFYHTLTGQWNNGGYAVEFFFIISGFMFNHSFNPSTSVEKFLTKKLIRLWPLQAFLSLISGLIMNEAHFDLYKYLTDFFMLSKTGLHKGSSGGFGYLTVAWFICVLFWILLFYFYSKKIMLPSVFNLIFGTITFASLFVRITWEIPDSCRLIRGLGAFGIGYFCFELCKSIHSNEGQKGKHSILVSCLELLLLAYFTKTLFRMKPVQGPVIFEILMGMFLVILYIKKGYVSSFLDKPIFSKVAQVVFSVYLSHTVFYYSPIIKILNNTVFHNPKITCIFGVIISFAFGSFIWYLLDRPVSKYLKERFL
ncbi:MAG: acyltransferase [Alphaproteobacteria bacterium]|nr:acyltransferase [Alphaproteobacteria bacterium]